jgi:hypothetical protein
MRKFLAVAALAAAGAVALAVLPSTASDHLDAPLVKKDGRTDINDVYVFQSPQNADRAVLAMTVNPGAGVISGTSFDSKATYNFDIDTNADALADKSVSVQFGPVEGNGHQRLTLTGPGINARGYVGDDVAVETAHGKPQSVGVVRAGVFDDPFFFDLAAFRNGLAFCPGGGAGTDFFLGLNTSAIIVEVPKTVLTGASSNISVEGRTRDKNGKQIDRFGRPAINTVFNHTDADKNAFNAGQPVDDQANFRGNVVSTLLALGNSQATADALADFLLPDVMTVDLSKPTVFPNGRGLADDVIDSELNLISGGAVPSDCVPNDSALQNTFPYFGTAN